MAASSSINDPLLQVHSEFEDDGVVHFSPRFLQLFNFFVSRKHAILVAWAVVFLVCSTQAAYYVGHSLDIPTAPRGSRADVEGKEFATRFPVQAEDIQLIAVVACNESVPTCHATCKASACKRGCKGENPLLAAMFAKVNQSLYEWADVKGYGLTGYDSYYKFANTKLDQAKCQLASKNGRVTFGLFTYSITLDKSVKHAIVDKLNALLKEHTPKDFISGLSGVDPLGKAGSEESEKQVLKVDIFTMPVAFALFALMVRSWRLLLLCLMNALLTVVASFGFLAIVERVSGREPLSVNAQLIEVIGLAMNIDYSLFLLRRFRDEIMNGNKPIDAIKIMLHQAGHVVFMSSFTFAMVFMGFVFLPSTDLATMGQACVVTVLIALTVAISNTTSMLMAFPDFFSALALPGFISSRLGGSAASNAEPRRVDFGVTVTGHKRHRRGAPYKGLYFRMLRTITLWPYNVFTILVVYGLATPLALNVFRIALNQDPMSIAPRAADAVVYYNILAAQLPGGLMGPFSVIVVPKDEQWTFDNHGPEFFNAMTTVTEFLSEGTGVSDKQFLSPALLQGIKVPYALSKALLNKHSIECIADGDLCAMYEFAFNRAVNLPDKNAVIITVTPPYNTFSPDGQRFVKDAYKAIDRNLLADFKVLLCGVEVDMTADIDSGLGHLPLIMGLTVLVLCVFIGAGFQSALVPVRLSLTVLFPLATVYGMAVLVYQDGALNWLGWEAVSTHGTVGFFWIIPLLCVMIGLGLALDYDVFLVHRIFEHRSCGYGLQASIVKSVWEINSVIIVAGLIMCAVFSGMLLSTEKAMDQFGFLMSVSVLVNVFIVQCFLIPAVISALGDRIVWWPKPMPTRNLITLEDEEFQS